MILSRNKKHKRTMRVDPDGGCAPTKQFEDKSNKFIILFSYLCLYIYVYILFYIWVIKATCTKVFIYQNETLKIKKKTSLLENFIEVILSKILL